MNYLLYASKKVEKIFAELEEQTLMFQTKSGLQCKNQCNLCCVNKKLETSVLEMLPMAIHLYKEKLTDQTLEELCHKPEICVHLSHLQVEGKLSGCTQYKQRPLICRLFGFSGITDKFDRKNIYTCHTIKTEQQKVFHAAIEKINGSPAIEIPMASWFQSQLDQIDPLMANDYNHINISLEKALNKVAYFYENRPKRPSGMNKAC